MSVYLKKATIIVGGHSGEVILRICRKQITYYHIQASGMNFYFSMQYACAHLA